MVQCHSHNSRKNVNKLTKDDQLFNFDLCNTFFSSHQAEVTVMGYLEDKGYNKMTKVILVMLITLISISIP